MGTPRIGASTYGEHAKWGAWDTYADLLHVPYSDSIVAAGGLPLLLPPSPVTLAVTAVAAIDGLVITGGADVDPARYGQAAGAHTDVPRTDRDEWELALLREALQRDIPVLAICRGLQLLNVALGGTLVQHLPDTIASSVHAPGVGQYGRHSVELVAGSRIAKLYGERTDVATYHHQGIDDVGDGLVVTGRADDGVIEAVELPGYRWVVAVQWHPEAFNGAALFDDFVTAASPEAS